ncbi:hypothetical protein ACFRAE_07630 [Sphingobacterium sp. HJSM2_6]|uniref:hypothetical protein n=1 Tax=Sphingobacterium sp. HJSM2_6 TaxID=3366264 RepID=UPI003BD9DEDB
MDQLKLLIGTLDENDIIDLKSFLNKKNKRLDVKNIKLLDILKTDDINKQKKLFSNDKNLDAYHALRKRLSENILLFISQKAFESSQNDTYEILRYLLMSHFLFENNLEKLAIKSIARAEKLALKLEQYSLLNELLLTKLQYAHLYPQMDLDQLTEQFQINLNNLQREAKMNLAYAFIRKHINEINLQGKIINLTDLIGNTIQKFKIATVDFMNYKSLYQILFIANEFAAIYQNYNLIAPYVRKTYRYIQANSSNKEAHTYQHLYILYYIANFLFRSKDFAQSQKYLLEMQGVLANNNSYLPQFQQKHQLIWGLNQYFTGNREGAIETIKHALTLKSSRNNPQEIDDLTLSLVLFYAQNNESKALHFLSKLSHTDVWYEKKYGMLWIIRKNLMQILVYLQFEQIDLSLSRIKSFKRRYQSYLNSIKEFRVLQFLKIIEKYIQQPKMIHDKRNQEEVLALLQMEENKDIFNISFIAWFIAIWRKETSYQITLELISEIQNENLPVK